MHNCISERILYDLNDVPCNISCSETTPSTVDQSIKPTPSTVVQSIKPTPSTVDQSIKPTPSTVVQSIKPTPSTVNQRNRLFLLLPIGLVVLVIVAIVVLLWMGPEIGFSMFKRFYTSVMTTNEEHQANDIELGEVN
ncbi:uncharacterized protein LOC114456145 isoform X2 [Gouania willdenowi]|nr:uncharacterized protein LOC114456145 isoform X2 [Gouania willdenowi]